MKKSVLRVLVAVAMILAIFLTAVGVSANNLSDVARNNPGKKINIDLFSKFAPQSTSPISWITFDNNLTDQANTSQVLTANGSHSYVAGPVSNSKALRLEGGDGNYASMSEPLTLNDDSFTISFWYKGETNSNQVILSNKSFENANDTAGWAIYTSPNRVNMNMGFSGESVKTVSVGRNTFEASAWRHVTFVVDRDTMLATLYIDGFSMAEVTLSHGDLDTSNPICIGADTAGGRGGNAFAIAELKIWDNALNRAAVQMNYKDYDVNQVDMTKLEDTVSKASTLVMPGLGSGFDKGDFEYLKNVLKTANTVVTTQGTTHHTQETINYYVRELNNAIFIYEKSNKKATPADLSLITQGDTEMNLNPATKVRIEEDFKKQLKAFPQADAIFIAGDVTGGNASQDYVFMKEMRDVYEKLGDEGFFDNLDLYMVRGNHDMGGTEQFVPEGTAGAWNPDTESYDNNFLNGAYRVKIKGYNLLGFDGAYDNANTSGKINGYLNDIKAEVDYDPSKPVFVASHYPISNTIWGGAWGSSGSNTVAKHIADSGMSQIVYLSGHTHYDPTDERSFYQGNATYYEAGSNAYSTYIDPGPYGGYIEGSYITYKTTPRILEFVEIYDTKMIVKFFNLSTEKYVGTPIVATVGEGKDAFTYSKSNTKDLIAPEFEEDSITIDSCKSDKVNFTLKQASDNVRVLEYNMQLINTLTGNVEKSFNSLAMPREVPFEEYRKYSFTELSPETPYLLRVFAADSMYNRSSQDILFKTPAVLIHDITPNETTFDLANPADVEVHCALPKDVTIDGIKYGDKTLEEGTDYHYGEDTLTIAKAYLLQCAPGKKLTLRIAFNEGIDQLLAVYVVNTDSGDSDDCEIISNVAFEDDTYSDKGTGKNLTAYGNNAIVPGAYGTSKAVHIPAGNGNYLDYGSESTTLFGDDSFTISFWYKGDLKSYETMIGNKNWGSAKNTGIYFGSYQQGIIGFNVGDGSQSYYVNTGNLDAYDIKNNWTLVTAIIDRENVDETGKGTCRILINGNIEAQGKIPVKNFYDDTRTLKVGVCGDKTYGNNDVYMDDLNIWRGAMSIQGVQSLYQSYKKEVTINDVTVTAKTYDGSRIAPTGTPTIKYGETAVEDVIPIYTYQGINDTAYGPSNRAPKDAGDYRLTLSMPIASDYVGTSDPIEFAIAKAPLTVDNVTVKNKTYNGKTDATVTGVTFEGLANGEVLAMTTDYEMLDAAFASVNPQQQIAVTGTVVLTASEKAHNYDLANGAFPAATKADITRANIEATPPATIIVSVGESSFDLRTIALSESDYGDRSFSLGTFTDTEGIFTTNPSIGSDGYTLGYTVGNTAPKGSTATQVFTITTQNYVSVEGTITFKMDEIIISWQNPFIDIKEDAWYYGDVRFVNENGLYEGTSATTFSPQEPMTRGMVVAVLGRYAKADIGKYTSSSFIDVEAGFYYTPYIEWAKEIGVVYGISETHFAPDQNVTREQIATIFYRYAKAADLHLPTDISPVRFGDNDQINAYAKDSVAAMQCAGVIYGKGNNRFDPKADSTRAEVAAMLHRLALLAE